jgi:hypothetical protein
MPRDVTRSERRRHGLSRTLSRSSIPTQIISDQLTGDPTTSKDRACDNWIPGFRELSGAVQFRVRNKFFEQIGPVARRHNSVEDYLAPARWDNRLIRQQKGHRK